MLSRSLFVFVLLSCSATAPLCQAQTASAQTGGKHDSDKASDKKDEDKAGSKHKALRQHVNAKQRIVHTSHHN